MGPSTEQTPPNDERFKAAAIKTFLCMAVTATQGQFCSLGQTIDTHRAGAFWSLFYSTLVMKKNWNFHLLLNFT